MIDGQEHGGPQGHGSPSRSATSSGSSGGCSRPEPVEPADDDRHDAPRSSTGTPGMSTGVRHRRHDGGRDAHGDRLAVPQPRPQQREEGGRGRGIQPVRPRIAEHVAQQRAGERREVPADVDRDAR